MTTSKNKNIKSVYKDLVAQSNKSSEQDSNYLLDKVFNCLTTTVATDNLTTTAASTVAQQVTQQTPKKTPGNHNKRWSDDDVSTLISMYAAGVAPSIIADELERTVVSVLAKLTEYGLVYFDKKENAYFTIPAMLYRF